LQALRPQLFLFDHLVGDGENAWRDAQAKHLGRPEVDHELKFNWLRKRQIGPLPNRAGGPAPTETPSKIASRAV
jgi:hypothetical protein